jgi:hypothetical protein
LAVVFGSRFALCGALDDPLPGLAPYFDKPIGDIDTYSRGQAIASRCPELDDLAVREGVRTVSSFGFSDDFRGETLTWHDAADGIDTFVALKDVLSRTAPQSVALRDELDLVINALEKARAKSARFCLLITYGFTNAMEHEQRKGSFL